MYNKLILFVKIFQSYLMSREARKRTLFLEFIHTRLGCLLIFSINSQKFYFLCFAICWFFLEAIDV